MDDVGFPWWLYLVFPGAFLAIGLFAAVLIYATRAKPQEGLGGGRWNTCVFADSAIGRMKGTLGATFGVMDLDDGRLSFVADGEQTPRWSVPTTELGVRPELLTVRLQGPMGRLSCTVSRERVNRFSNNSLKSMRERRYAREFVEALHAMGARTW